MKTKSKPKKYSRPTNWAPKPSVLIAERSKNLGWNPALAELVDNSFDAGAKNVRIILPSGVGDTFEISDDGCGCEDITIIMQQGARVRHDSSRSGKYGFGAKPAIIYIWGEVEIVVFGVVVDKILDGARA